MMSEFTYIGPIKQVVPMTGLPENGPLADEQLVVLDHAGILMKGDQLYQVGDHTELLAEARTLEASIITLTSDMVALPGLIDSHTHICFGGNRARDYAMRNAGKTYLEIAHAGGGIWDTVTQTRMASEETLRALTRQRANLLAMKGITTIEVKSGYGLSVQEELKMLRAISAAGKETQADLIPTCLAAHMVPRDYSGSGSEYLEEMMQELFPVLIQESLTRRIDAFIEDSAFTAEDIQPYFQKARESGFDITVHADQFHTGGSEVAVHFQAVSADHLEASGDKEVSLLAHSQTVATALPGASLGLGMRFTPARRILDQGGVLAIASDWNPGSAPMGDLLTQASILGAFEKLSNAEVLAGITQRSAQALRLSDRGELTKGKKADIVFFPCENYQEITYRQGQLTPEIVVKNGRIIFRRS
jgi:imidazolonepropionase